MAARSVAARVLFLVAIAAVAMAQDGMSVLETFGFQRARGDTPRPLFNALVYAATWTLCVTAIAVLLLHPWRWLRGLGFAAVLFLSSVHVGFGAVNGIGFGHHEAALLWSESQFAGSALQFFAPYFLGPVALWAAVWAVLFWLGSRLAFRRGALAALALAGVASFAAVELTRQTFGKVYQFPPAVRVPVLTHWAWAHKIPFYGKREAPRLEPRQAPLTDHLVLVMDESVSGHWLGVNGASPDVTPWLSSGPPGVFNYGLASSISNLSSSTNLLLQAGLRPDQLPDRELRALRSANVFDYLGRAGFRTALIDAQSYSRRPPNLMTRFDLDAIDHHWQLKQLHPELAEHAVDGASLPLLEELLATSPRSFSYVIKNGAHLPYSDKFPRSHALADTHGVSKTLLDYAAAVGWSSDGYLEALARAIEASGEEALVIYTADHGQSLEEPDFEPGRDVSPHATAIDPPAAQASVPLILLAFGPRTRAAIEARFHPVLVDRASGFEIFSTLLESAGYARDELGDFSASLFDAEALRRERLFASGNVFAQEGGFYVLNPDIGSACHLNRFEAPPARRVLPVDPGGSGDTRGEAGRETDTSPRGSGTS